MKTQNWLLAESGSTKTTWVLYNGKIREKEFLTSGFNPYTQSAEQMSETVQNELIPNIKDIEISQIFFYGAGCSTPESVASVEYVFRKFFVDAEIVVEHDLTAAILGLWGKGEGIVAIIGTGSNSCVAVGGVDVASVPNLGYILGDEGSGAHFGKKLVTDFIYRKMPEVLEKRFAEKYNLTREEVLQRVYKQANPNRWLAGFAPFIKENFVNEYCHVLVHDCFDQFFGNHISRYSNFGHFPMGAVGSIAYYFKDELHKCAHRFGFNLEKVLISPMEGLEKFHLTPGPSPGERGEGPQRT